MPKKRHLPKSDQALLMLYAEHSIAQIAADYNLTEQTVSRRIAKALLNSPNLDPKYLERRDQMKKLIQEGKNWRVIGNIIGLSPEAARHFANRTGLHHPPVEFAFGIPAGCCPDCIKTPCKHALCFNCYQRFRRRRKRKLINYGDEHGRLLIFQHPEYTVYYTEATGYEIHTMFFNTVYISKPTSLEKLLLDHFHREILTTLDKLAIQEDTKLVNQESHADPN